MMNSYHLVHTVVTYPDLYPSFLNTIQNFDLNAAPLGEYSSLAIKSNICLFIFPFDVATGRYYSSCEEFP